MIETRTSRHLVTLDKFEDFLRRDEPQLVPREVTTTANLLVDFCNYKSRSRPGGELDVYCVACGAMRSNCTNPTHVVVAGNLQVEAADLFGLIDRTPLGWMPHVGPVRLSRIKRWLTEEMQLVRKVTNDLP